MSRRGAQKGDDFDDLPLDVFLAESDLSKVHLRENAPRRPQVNLGIVGFLLVLQEELGSAEPAGHNVGGEIVLGVDLLVFDGRETKVTNFQLVVAVDEQVLGLYVPVDDTGGVDVLEAPEELVHEIDLVLPRDA